MPTRQSQIAAAVLSAALLTSGAAFAQGAFSTAPSPTMSIPAETAPAPAVPAPAIPAPAAPAATAPVPQAQAVPQGGSDCGSIQKTLIERKNLVAKANAASNSKKKMTPQEACALFGKLQANGAEGVKWIAANKEWCSIPDSFAEGFKADHSKVAQIRTKVCGMAAQATKMEAQARAQAQNGGGGGLLGGPGLTGSFKMPQGAL
ncbi:hypothetical protein [Methylobacterium organophilum]|uniref:Uncharacterized protein n=1 Tax=Methylobacterium organophilum TaxID=410 RepID=A0ABQ4T5G3_METOR|nr:hypothetical protein LKMONMHP_0720 [Methylobacterium organophilum]